MIIQKYREKIILSRSAIVKPIFGFLDGRRFYFTDLTQNEYVVWSDK